MHINVDKIYVRIDYCQYLQICNLVKALDRCKHFISAQYLVYCLAEFDQIVYADKRNAALG